VRLLGIARSGARYKAERRDGEGRGLPCAGFLQREPPPQRPVRHPALALQQLHHPRRQLSESHPLSSLLAHLLWPLPQYLYTGWKVPGL